MKARFCISILIICSLASLAHADISLSTPKVGDNETRDIEGGASPQITVNYTNTTGQAIILSSAGFHLTYDQNLIDYIVEIDNEQSKYLYPAESITYKTGEIYYGLAATNETLSLPPGQTIKLATLTLHISDQALPTSNIKLLDWSSSVPYQVYSGSNEVTGRYQTPATINLVKAEPPDFKGLNRVFSGDVYGRENVGNAIVLEWMTAGNGASDKTRYSNGKLSYRVYRNTKNDFGPKSGAKLLSTEPIHSQYYAPQSRKPYTGNIPGTDYVYQDYDAADGTLYYYKVVAVDDCTPTPNVTTNVAILSAMSLDLTPPGEVENLKAIPGDYLVKLKWVNPKDDDLGGIIILRSSREAISNKSLGQVQNTPPYKDGPTYKLWSEPFGPGRGQVIFINDLLTQYATTECIDWYADNGITYHYKAYAYDTIYQSAPRKSGHNYSKGAAIAAQAGIAPRPVTDFKSEIGQTPDEIVISWKNSKDYFTEGTLIRYSKDDYAALGDHNAGKLLGAFDLYAKPGSKEALVLTGKPNQRYIFKAFAYNQTADYLEPTDKKSMAIHQFSAGQTTSIKLASSTIESQAITAAVKLYPKVQFYLNQRLYQPKVSKTIVNEQPEIEIKINLPKSNAYLPREIQAYSLLIDEKTSQAISIDLASQTIYSMSTSGPDSKLSGLTLKHLINEPLTEGQHTITFKIPGNETISALTQTVSFEVLAGPLRLTKAGLSHPNPFSITRNKQVTIQYGLSKNADIDLYIIAGTGKRVKKFAFDSGLEGGRAGLNKIVWDGQTDMGHLLGNGIYVGAIISREESKILGKFKLSVVN